MVITVQYFCEKSSDWCKNCSFLSWIEAESIQTSLPTSQRQMGSTQYTSCKNNNTSIQNTICYPEDQHIEKCPITEIFIADQNTGNLLKESGGTSVVLDYRVDDPTRRYLVYSKYSKDNLPLTTTALDTRPCINPTQTSSLLKFYPNLIPCS